MLRLLLLLQAAASEVLRGSQPARGPVQLRITMPKSGVASNTSSIPYIQSTPWDQEAADLPSNVTSLHAVNRTEEQVQMRGPRVYFLFMAVDKVSNLQVWDSFFGAAHSELYRAYVHCKLDSCNAQVANSRIKAISRVPSYYCTDLVSPMNHLLNMAMQDDGASKHHSDKFVFLSDSTLPGKPFSFVYATLVNRQSSDFCVFPANEWADVHSGVGRDMVPKAHQWVTLGRSHAEKAVRLWGSGHMHNFMQYFQMNYQQWQWSNNSYGDSRNFGCLDEFWYLAAVYGYFSNIDPHQERMVDLHQFTNGPLRIGASAGWQGECDTFVMWSQYLHFRGPNPFLDFYNTLDGHSIPHGGNSARPGWWDAMSTSGMRSIRASKFLFIRKFIDNPRLVDGNPLDFQQRYTQIVLM